MTGARAPVIVHATCVALNPHAAALIMGRSGAGKSALALRMMALGAHLVADDRTCLVAEGASLVASAPPSLAGLIEARGIGILRLPALARAEVTLAVDLDRHETERLPPHRRIVLCGCEIDLVHGPVSPHFDAALMLYLAGDRHG